MNKVVIKVVNDLANISIIKKLIIGYIVIIFIPFSLISYLFYNQFYNDWIEKYSKERQQYLQKSYSDLKINFAQVESTYQLLQYNTNFIEYLRGFHESDSESIYFFLKDIRPLFSQILTAQSFADDLTVYVSQNNVKGYAPEIIQDDREYNKLDKQIPTKTYGEGYWRMQPNKQSTILPTISFYQRIYNRTYTENLGILKTTVEDHLLEDFITNLSKLDNDSIFLVSEDGEILYESDKSIRKRANSRMALQQFSHGDENEFFIKGEDLLVNSIYIDDLSTYFIKIGNADTIFADSKNSRNKLLIILLFLLLTLSGIYYFLSTSISRRILKLATHMRTVDRNNFSEYIASNERDEIGYLTSSYNSMLKRIEHLVNKIQAEELMRKEAEYLALQSQINPHFIYNTLETIRMLAEVNNDEEVSEIAYTFGELMRYSLSPKKNEATLAEELDHVQNFLKVHKIRMGERLDYQLEVDIDLHLEHFLCPRFILQPIVENSIVHGLAKSRNLGKLIIRVKEESDVMYVEVIDNGKGITKSRLQMINNMLNGSMKISEFQTNDGGLALFNVSERLRLFNGEKSNLSIDSNYGEGTRCVLTLQKGS